MTTTCNTYNKIESKDLNISLQPVEHIIKKANKYANETVTNHVENNSFCIPKKYDLYYDIILTNLQNVESVEIIIDSDFKWKRKVNIDETSVKIDIFTESTPLLMYHLAFATVSILVYPKNNGDYSYDVNYTGRYLFLGLLRIIWYKIPVVHYIGNGNLIFYNTEGYAITMHVSTLHKFNLSPRNISDYHFVSESIEKWTVCVRGNPGLPVEAFYNIKVTSIAKVSEWTVCTYPPIKEIYIEGQENLDKFMKLSKELWNNDTYIYKKHSKIDEDSTNKVQEENIKKIKVALNYISNKFYPASIDFSDKIKDKKFIANIFLQDLEDNKHN